MFLSSVWGMAGYVAYELKRDLEYLLAQQQHAMADSIAQAIGSSVRLRRESLQMLSSDIKPGNLKDRGALEQLLSHYQAMPQLFDIALIVTTPTGRVLAKYPPLPVQTDERFIQGGLTQAIVESKKILVGAPTANGPDTTAIIPFGAPIVGKDGAVLGILLGIATLKANEFIDEVTDRTSDIGYLVVSPSSRLILAASDKERVMTPAPRPGANLLLDRFLQGYEGSGVSVSSRGVEELSSGTGVKGTDWVVAITMPTDEAFAPVVQMQRRIFVSAAILSLVVALLTWLSLQKAMRPLEYLVKSVRKMGTSDASLQQPDLKHSGHEISELLEAFYRMQQRIVAQAAVLSENEARFHFVADYSPILIWISDETGRRTWFNQTWLRSTSQSLDQLLSGTWIDDIHPDDRAHYLETDGQTMLARKRLRTKFRLRDSGGAYRWFLEMAVPRYIGDKFVGYVGSCLDIDEQVVAQSKSEALLRGNRKLIADRFSVEETEHRRLARDLHDDLGQWLTAISANAEAIRAIAGREGQEKIHYCATSIVASTGAIQDFVRAMNRKLGSDTLATLGLKESLVELISAWREQYTGLVTEFSFDDTLLSLDKHLETTVFRLVQEALTNVARHAKATRVCLVVCRQRTAQSDELLVSIADDGIGFDIEHDSRGVGLISMRERAVALCGSCTIVTGPNNGTSVEVRIPLEREPGNKMNDHAYARI